MVNAVMALGGVIGLGLAVPLITSLVPSPEAVGNEWSPLTADEWAGLQKATDKPIKVTFSLHEVDGYLPPADTDQFVWAVKATEADFKAKRPELFASGGDKLPYPVGYMGFTIFSPICPHLGCRYSWVDARSRPAAAPRYERQSRTYVDRIQAEHPRPRRLAHRLIGEVVTVC
jgi:Rieske Fe-S protein